MFTPYNGDDARNSSRGQHDAAAVQAVLARRRSNRSHSLYGVAAGVFGTVSIYVWAGIRADVEHRVSTPLTTDYAAFLAASAVLGISAVATTLTWLIVFHMDRRAREVDAIHEYHEDRQMRAIQQAMDVFLAEGDATARTLMEQVQTVTNGMNGATVSRFPSRGSGRGQLIAAQFRGRVRVTRPRILGPRAPAVHLNTNFDDLHLPVLPGGAGGT